MSTPHPDPPASRTPLENLLAGQPSVPVPPGIAARITITPEQVNTAAKNFAVGQHDLADAWMRLSGALDAAEGMAGDDKPGHVFAARYEAAVRVAWKAFSKAIVVLGGTSGDGFAGRVTSAEQQLPRPVPDGWARGSPITARASSFRIRTHDPCLGPYSGLSQWLHTRI